MKSYTYKVETYALFTHVDESILLLNPVIAPYGFRFISVPIDEIEKDFSDIVGLEKNYVGTEMIRLHGKNLIVSSQFYGAALNNPMFGFDLIHHQYIILLKKITDFERKVENYQITEDPSGLSMQDILQFTNNLIYQLRLLKNCYVNQLMVFLVAENNRTVVGRHSGLSAKEFAITNLDICPEDVKRFAAMFTTKFNINELSAIAFEFFTISHIISETKSRFITLMTALESIFNTGAGRIAHTISKHMALILTRDPKEFDAHYNRLKQLYAIRSELVHGNSLNRSVENETEELKTYVRKALLYTLSSTRTKAELFEYLNQMGVV